MRILLVLALLSYSLPIIAQSSTNCNQYVQYRSGLRECFSSVEQKWSNNLLADGKKIKISDVDLFKTGSGYYVVDWREGNNGTFERIEYGKRVSLFHQFYTSTTTNYDPNFGATTSSTSVSNYLYSKDEGRLLKFKLKNLKLDLADNPESMVFLKQASNTSKLQTALYVIGYSTVLAGIIQTGSNIKEGESGGLKLSPLIFIGAGVAWVPYFMGKGKHKKMQLAVEAYNK